MDVIQLLWYDSRHVVIRDGISFIVITYEERLTVLWFVDITADSLPDSNDRTNILTFRSRDKEVEGGGVFIIKL